MKKEFLVVDPLARTIVRRWPPGGGVGQFADGGRVVCSGGDVEETGRAPVACWDVNTGEKIGVAAKINGGFPMATAARSSRIIASDYKRIWNPWWSFEYGALLKRRVVWDLREPRELASWRPEVQSYTDIGNERAKEPFKFAISPDGQYVAEGGSGLIRLFKIEP